MNYEIEELIPLVGELAEKYTAFESTSISYEKAEQLMGAVVYCIQEAERPEYHLKGKETGESEYHLKGKDAGGPEYHLKGRDAGGPESNVGILSGNLTARQAYEIGAGYVEQKARRALKLYHEILPGFCAYGNRCLKDTFEKGFPEFFRFYDMKFEPQNTILTLDYPVLKDLSASEGIDRIYEYLCCLRLEQRFLEGFPEGLVQEILEKNNDMYEELIENICETVFCTLLAHMLIRKPWTGQAFTEADRKQFRKIGGEYDLTRLRKLLWEYAEQFYRNDSEEKEELREYFGKAVEELAIRLKHLEPEDEK